MPSALENKLKQERKEGIAAMRKMMASENYNAAAVIDLARRNEQQFETLDALRGERYLAEIAQLKPIYSSNSGLSLYAVFWWWRRAQEGAGRTQETDEAEIKQETRYRCFMITQFLAAPFSDDWEDDRKTLKEGVEPWITENQILDGLHHKTIKRFAWIWHDKDVYTEQDEIADIEGKIRAGDAKFKHCHIMVDIPAKVTISTVARWFGVPVHQIKVMRGNGAFLDGVEYLVHENPTSVDLGKTHYNDEDVYCSAGFDFRADLSKMQANRLKFGQRAGEMTAADNMRINVLLNGWTLKNCRDDDPITYAKIRNVLAPLRLDYLSTQPPCPLRINLYVDGPGGVGKSTFGEYLASALYPSWEAENNTSPFFAIGNDDRVTFDGYDGQPVIIWDDMRVTDFIRQFGSNGTYRILDPHPRIVAQQAKHSRIILNNQVNIINGVQPYNEFIAGLAGSYTDKDGVRHEAEDENQAWRRFPLILCIRPNDFDVLINEGFVNNDLTAIKTMRMYANMRGSLKMVMQLLDGAAKKYALSAFAEPVLSAVELLQGHNDNKIVNPEDIPADLMPTKTVQLHLKTDDKAADQ